jgi:putative serine protease PepD
MSADDQQVVPGAEHPPVAARLTGSEPAPSNPFASPSGPVPAAGPIPASAPPGDSRPAASATGPVEPGLPVDAFPYGRAGRSSGGGAPEPVRARRPRGRTVAWLIPVVLVSALAGAGGALLVDRTLGQDGLLTSAGLPAPVLTDVPSRAPDSVAGLAASVLPSVVAIQVTTSTGTSTGSGLVLRADGYLLTNNHVVADAATTGAAIEVLFSDGSREQATLVGRTPDYDLAVIKVGRTGLTPLVLGDSDQVVVGDPVIAIGAPLGLQGTVTTGIVSAKNRPVSAGSTGDTAFINAIQTDAAINPGNSGGPLVNAAGEVIGINSAIAQPPGASGGSVGLGFAIPSNQARRTAEQLIETGTATYPVIGVRLDQAYAGEGVRVADDSTSGAAAVTKDGPADRAGIRAGDVILAIDGRPVTDPDELVVAIRAKAPGDTVLLRVRSGSAVRDVRVVLQEATSG